MATKHIHIGCTQWGYKEWVGKFYKDGTPAKRFLAEYATVFNTVEGNTTFYRVPSAETVQNWGAQVPDGFKFCFKFPQSITHYKRLKNADSDIFSFLERFDGIAPKLGPFHIQLHAGFSFSEFAKLEHLCEILPTHLHYAIEVRHPDYYDQGRQERMLLELLRNRGIDRVIFDTRRLHELRSNETSIRDAQKRKPVLPVRFDATASRPFLRYVGANDILNNETYLTEWAMMVSKWIQQGHHPYLFIHSPDTLHAPKLARFFHSLLTKFTDVGRMPVWPADREDEQLGLWDGS